MEEKEKEKQVPEEGVPMEDKSTEADEVTQLNIFRFNVATPGSRLRQSLKRKPEKEVDQSSSAKRFGQDCRQQGTSIIFLDQLSDLNQTSGDGCFFEERILPNEIWAGIL
mgnify:CR=1 FL=1